MNLFTLALLALLLQAIAWGVGAFIIRPAAGREFAVTSNAQVAASMRRGAAVLGAGVFLLGVLVLLGWVWDIPALKSVRPEWMTMKPSSAACFVLTGAALWLSASKRGEQRLPRLLVRVFAAAAALTGLLELFQFAGGWDFGMSAGLFGISGADGRMSPATALSFALTGGALFIGDSPAYRERHPAQPLAITAGGLALLAVIGYLYGVESLYAVSPYHSMAFHTALGFFALGIGILWSKPGVGWMRLVSEARPGGFVLRWMIPIAITLPILLGWARLVGQRMGLYGTEFGLALMVFSGSVTFILLGWHIAVALNAADKQRAQAEDETRRLNQTLEAQVEERTRQLREAQEKLLRQERLAVLGQLAGSVGHELRNPLGVISNAAYFLSLIQPEAGAKVKEYHGIIKNEVNVADKIINDLLHFGREKAATRESAPVSRLAEEALGRFPPPETIRLVSRLEPESPTLSVDLQQLTQALGNLLVNAYQSMPAGGQVTLSARREGDGWVAIAVRDEGVGIPPENMAKLFEPLFTTKPRGIGLGLAVSRKLVEANGGRLEVQSEAGRGSVFTILLPDEERQP